MNRARLPTYCTLGNLRKLLPRAVATGPFAKSTAVAGEKCGLADGASSWLPCRAR